MPRKHANTFAVIDMIAAERIRQIETEGFSHAHDDQYRHGELPRAAACYAMNVGKSEMLETSHNTTLSRQQFAAAAMPPDWPWPGEWWKPYSPLQDLVRASALLVAEIERRLRDHSLPALKPPGTPPSPPDDAYVADRRFATTTEARAIIEGAPSDIRARLAEACAVAGFACRFLPARMRSSLCLTLAAPPSIDLKSAMDQIAAQGFRLFDRTAVKDHADPAICAHVDTGIRHQAQDALEDA